MALFARTWIVQAFVVPSVSMAPTLLPGDHVLVNRFVQMNHADFGLRSVERASVLVVRDPEDPARLLVKRCVGLPGDNLRIVDKTLEIDGSPMVEPYAAFVDPDVYPASRFLDPPLRHRDNVGPMLIEPGQLFCLGDNRDDSLDSRVWGPVRDSDVIGQAVLVYWSTSAIEGGAARVGSDGDQAGEGSREETQDPTGDRGGLDGVFRFVTRARAERIFRWIR